MAVRNVGYFIATLNSHSLTSLSFFLLRMKRQKLNMLKPKKHKVLNPEDFHMEENLLTLPKT